jgi:hypothetical protein
MTALLDRTDGGRYDNAFAQEVIASYADEPGGKDLLINGFMNMSVILLGKIALGSLSESDVEKVSDNPEMHIENLRKVLRNVSTVLNEMDAEADHSEE